MIHEGPTGQSTLRLQYPHRRFGRVRALGLVFGLLLLLGTACGAAGDDTAEPAAQATNVGDDERCDDALTATEMLASSVDTMMSTNNSAWVSVELLLSSSLGSLTATLEGADHDGLVTARQDASTLQARLDGLESFPDYQWTIDFGRDALDLSIDVATHCLAIATDAG